MKIKLKKAGTNPIQREYSWLVSDTEDRVMLEIGDKFHIDGQPRDVWWIVESIEHGQSKLPDVLSENQPEIGN